MEFSFVNEEIKCSEFINGINANCSEYGKLTRNRWGGGGEVGVEIVNYTTKYSKIQTKYSTRLLFTIQISLEIIRKPRPHSSLAGLKIMHPF